MTQLLTLAGKRSEPPTVRSIAIVPAILAAAMAFRASDLTLADLGWGRRTDDAGDSQQPELHLSAWRYMDAPDRLVAQAGQQRDLCALALAGINLLWAGGYTYLHRDVPFYPISPRMLATGSLGGANYVIAAQGMSVPSGLVLVASEGDLNLYRRDGTCGPPPSYYTRLLTMPNAKSR